MEKLKRILSMLLVIVMVAGMLPVQAYATEEPIVEASAESTPVETFAEETLAQETAVEGLTEEVVEIIELPEQETSAYPFGGLSLDGSGKAALKDGNYVNWIDRLDLTGAEYALTFYEWLEDNIDGALMDPSVNTTTIISNGSMRYVYLVTTFRKDNAGTAFSLNEAYNIVSADIASNRASATAHVTAAYNAFDRDHAEVFWRTGRSSVISSYSYGYSGDGTVHYTQNIYFLLQSNDFDIRDATYPDADAIQAAINRRDSDIRRILGKVTGSSTYEKIKQLNTILTTTNCYNTDLKNGGHDIRECVSALEGRTGTEGPVCEGYARALKVLCDELGIPCVLVDGEAVNSSGESGGHMWNYVQMDDGNWYAVDVTWNDPSVRGVSGAVSGYESEDYLLVGGDTLIGGRRFLASHPVSNTVSTNGPSFLNGPVLSSEAYDPSKPVCHNYKSKVIAPTCTNLGYTLHTCSICEDSYMDSFVNALGHDFGDWKVTTAATCAQKGTERRDCANCDDYETREVPETDHTYEAKITDPTCTEKGYTTHTCSCGESYVDSYVDATGHSYGEWTVTTAVTCTEKGEERRDCQNCEHFETQKIPATDHTYKSEVTAPKCEEQGYTTYTCACGKSYTGNEVPPTGHSYGEWKQMTAPSCTGKGGEYSICENCNNMEMREIPPTGHSFGEWQVTTAASCMNKGEERRDCLNCDHFETQEIPPTGHSYETEVIAPTCEEKGYTTYTCACGDSYTDHEVPPTGEHNYVNGICTICDAIGGKCGEDLTWEMDTDGTVTISGTGAMYDYTLASAGNVNPWYQGNAKKIVISEGVTSIGKYAFYGTDKLEEISISNSVISIGDSAFYCSALKEIAIPASVSSIGVNVFVDCPACIRVDEANQSYCSDSAGALYTKNIDTLIHVPSSFSGAYVILDGVKRIEDAAFYFCENITEVTIPDTATSIGKSAFDGCGIKRIIIPENVSVIEDNAFTLCNIESMRFKGNAPVFGNNVFGGSFATVYYPANNPTWTEEVMQDYGGDITWVPYGEEHVHEYDANHKCECGAIGGTCGENLTWTLVEGVLTISGTGEMDDYELVEYQPWRNYTEQIASIVMEDGIISIGDRAFCGLEALTSISIPDGTLYIGNDAFANCGNLTGVIFPNTVVSIGIRAFSECQSLEMIILPDSVISIEPYTFYGCSKLKNVTISSNTVSIGKHAFRDCVSLTEIEIPDSVIEIGDCAFSGCTSLVSMNIPDSVTMLGNYVFKDCSKLMSIELSSHLEEISEGLFYHCEKLSYLNIPESIQKIGKSAFDNCISLKTLVIPDCVISIGEGAFWNCRSLTSLTIPDSVTQIEANTFGYCRGLTSIEIHENITSIGKWAFCYCSGLTTITIPSGISKIEEYSFRGCDGLTSMEFSDSITEIGHHAFLDCIQIKDLFFTGDSCSIGNSFGNVTATAYYPANNPTWTEEIMQDYGGEITWKPYCVGEHTIVIDEAVSATCTKTGLTEGKHCSVCNEVLIAQIELPATGEHSFGDWEEITPASCLEKGEERRDCDNCDHFETQQIPAKGHTYEFTVTAPTCTEKGYVNHVCACGDSYVYAEISARGHSYGEWTEVTPSTCTEKGEERRDCGNCDDFETRETAAKGHSYESAVTAPTCTDNGYTTYTCSCGDSYTDNEVEANGHTWDEGKVTKEPTEETEGEKTYTCSVCKETRTEMVPTLDHVHTYTEKVTAPTCTEKGYTTYTCTCGESYTNNEVAALGHNWDAGTVTKQPTTESEGVMTYTCTNCPETKTEPIDKLPKPEVTGDIIRIAGSGRYVTATETATELKTALGVEKFQTVVVASGENFPDALAGSYLAAVTKAPILLTTKAGSNWTKNYIAENLAPGGTIYLLGSVDAISQSYEDTLNKIGTVKRLKGENRWETCVAILTEAGGNANEVLVCSGNNENFADALSASAVGKPILLINGQGTQLQPYQKEYLAGKHIIVIGDNKAVSDKQYANLAAAGASIERVQGGNRVLTSVAVANRFFPQTDFAVLAYGGDYPDALCGGPLAYLKGGPVLLAMPYTSQMKAAADYITTTGITKGVITGDTSVVADKTARTIFGLTESDIIEER